MSSPLVPATTQQYAKAIDPAVRKFFTNKYAQLDPMVEKVLNVDTQVDFNQQEQTMFGLGALTQVNEAQIFPEDVPMAGFTTTYSPTKFGVDVPISRELQKYDKSGLFQIKQLAEARANSAAFAVGQRGASLFNNGFNTGYTSYGDAKPLFSTSHTRADGGTAQSNASSSGIPLTEANYETGLLAFRQQVDDRGLAISSIPDTLLVPIALEKEAIIIVKSDLRSGTADNDINPYAMKEYKGGMANIISWNFISSYLGGSDTAWFLLDSKNHKVSWKWGWKPEIVSANETVGFRNQTIYFQVSFQSSIGWSDWRYAWGSPGNGAVYSS